MRTKPQSYIVESYLAVALEVLVPRVRICGVRRRVCHPHRILLCSKVQATAAAAAAILRFKRARAAT